MLKVSLTELGHISLDSLFYLGSSDQLFVTKIFTLFYCFLFLESLFYIMVCPIHVPDTIRSAAAIVMGPALGWRPAESRRPSTTRRYYPKLSWKKNDR
jgi:hypothetical protein